MFASITAAIAIIKMLLSIAPEIIALVQAIESPGNGASKKATVIGVIQAAAEALPADISKLLTTDGIAKFAGSAIDLIVSHMNITKQM